MFLRWILEHLTCPYPRKRGKNWVPHISCARRWLPTRGHSDVQHYRLLLIIWRLMMSGGVCTTTGGRPFHLRRSILISAGCSTESRGCTVTCLSGWRDNSNILIHPSVVQPIPTYQVPQAFTDFHVYCVPLDQWGPRVVGEW